MNNTLDGVVGPINEAADVLEKIAFKDMTARIQGDYKGDHAKIKESLNVAMENLDKALHQVLIAADRWQAPACRSAGRAALSQGSSEQASSLEEVSSSLQEMASMTRQNVLNAKEAKVIADEAWNSADQGVECMARMSSAIEKIKTSSIPHPESLRQSMRSLSRPICWLSKCGGRGCQGRRRRQGICGGRGRSEIWRCAARRRPRIPQR